jgi:hypothetical protein
MPSSPSNLAAVPPALAEILQPQWLSAALGGQFPGIEVTNVTPGPVVSRVSTNARFRIECASGVPAGLSPDLCVKSYFGPQAPLAVATGAAEAAFYRDLAPRTGVRTLRAVFAGVEAGPRQGIVITEDVIAQGATFLDATTAYSPDQASQSLSQLALLHAATWGDPAARALPWLDPRLQSHTISRGIPQITANFDSELGRGVPAETRDASRLFAAYQELADVTRAASPWTVIHGDAHVGNLYLDGQGRPSLVDWQLVQRGPWYLDVGYHIASALTVADRRAHEADLVRHYLAELRAAGIEPPAQREISVGLRLGILHGFYLWGITQFVARPITGALLHRLGTAAADHDAFTAPADARGR